MRQRNVVRLRLMRAQMKYPGVSDEPARAGADYDKLKYSELFAAF